MSPSADRVRTIAAAVLVGGALVVAGAPVAAVTEDPDSDPRRITAPEELPEPTSTLTLTLESPSFPVDGGFPLVSVSKDTEGTAEVAQTREEVDVVLDGNVLFGKDSATIRPRALARLREITALLREKGPGRIEVVGHTDDLGSAQHGLVLSRQRAQSVRAILEPALDGFTITSEGRGEAEPRVPNTDEESRALNRRVEIHYQRRTADDVE